MVYGDLVVKIQHMVPIGRLSEFVRRGAGTRRDAVASQAWRNPDTGHGGSVTPTRTYQTARGESCREYQQTVTIAGRTETAYGRACRDADGTWRLMN